MFTLTMQQLWSLGSRLVDESRHHSNTSTLSLTRRIHMYIRYKRSVQRVAVIKILWNQMYWCITSPLECQEMKVSKRYTGMGWTRSSEGLAVTPPNKVLAFLIAIIAHSRAIVTALAVALFRTLVIFWATKCRSFSGMVSYGSHRQNCRPKTNVTQLSIWKTTHKQATNAIQKVTTRTMKAELDGNCSIARKTIATTNAIALFIMISTSIVNLMWMNYRTPIEKTHRGGLTLQRAWTSHVFRPTND